MNRFDVNEFRKQLDTLQNMGSTRDLLCKIPGMGSMNLENLVEVDADEEIKRIKGIIDSMTGAERLEPASIDISRRRRIATGSGVDTADVSALIKQFDAMAATIKQMDSWHKPRW